MASTCPIDSARDDRKAARIRAERITPEPDSMLVQSFDHARAIMRSPAMKQGGGGIDMIDTSDPGKAPVFFLDGEAHKAKRATIARYFTPKAIRTRYQVIMEALTAELLGQLRASGRERLDLLGFDLAVAVAGDVVGLTNSDRKRMAGRLAALLSDAWTHQHGPIMRKWVELRKGLTAMSFFWHDVRPAIKVRRSAPREDVISHLLAEGYSNKMILVECMTYAGAGMVTTREFITMSAWHMFDDPDLRARFLSADDEEKGTILLEILRLEPIASLLYRKADPDAPPFATGKIERGALHAIDMHAVNTDEAAVGACPFALNPDRATNTKSNGAFMSFGDGAHFCPGWQVALAETRVFLDSLFRVPGIKLERAPDIGWSVMLQSYELRNAVVTCNAA
jgi:cytochrome P450